MDLRPHFLQNFFRPIFSGGRVLFFALAVILLATSTFAAPSFFGKYKSPRNKERPVRKSTRFIILHTTEGPAKGSGEKLKERGEAHYMIDTAGHIYIIIERNRVAFHCGKSMWNGTTSLDDCSIGIEMVGYHNKSLTAAQTTALKELIVYLKRLYNVPDERILPHSMVAYGTPNQWHKHSHRGRKRCGMRMATPSIRKKIGLTKRPLYDPDVKARRLVVADPELQQILFSRETATEKEENTAIAKFEAVEKNNVIGPKRSAWDIARDAYNSASTIYTFPDGTKKNGAEITNWKAIPTGTSVFIGDPDDDEPEKKSAVKKAGKAAVAAVKDLAGDDWNSSRTIYVDPTGKYYCGNQVTLEMIQNFPEGTRVFKGYKIDGPIGPKKAAFDICGANWNKAETMYLFTNGKIKKGSDIDASKIPAKTMVIFKD